MKKLVLAACAVASLLGTGCWVPVQISAGGPDVVYTLDVKTPMFISPEARVMRCNGPNQCVEVYHP